jgi:NitT/TauT family transport system substrate-binding protein
MMCACSLRAVLIVGALALFAPRPAVAEPVKVSDLGVLADAPFYIGIEKGYFAAEKIELSLQRFNSGQQAVAPLSSNQLQVAGGAVSAALFNAFLRDWPVRITMARARDVPRHSGNALIVRKDLQPQVPSLASLKGLKVALNAPAASMQFMLGHMLASASLKLSDVDVVYMGFPNMAAAFSTKAIDAATSTEPFTSRFEAQGLAYTLHQASDILRSPPMEVAVLLYNTDWAEKNADEARRFSAAYIRGVRDYTDALQGGQNRGEIVSILIKYTNVKDPAAYDRMDWSWMDPNGQVSLEGLRAQQDWYAAQGSVPKKVPVEQMVDRRFLDDALARIGRVQSKF